MNICEDCQHKEVCQFKDGGKPDVKGEEGEPFEYVLQCKHKLFMPTVNCPSVWTYTYPDGSNVSYAITNCVPEDSAWLCWR